MTPDPASAAHPADGPDVRRYDEAARQRRFELWDELDRLARAQFESRPMAELRDVTRPEEPEAFDEGPPPPPPERKLSRLGRLKIERMHRTSSGSAG